MNVTRSERSEGVMIYSAMTKEDRELLEPKSEPSSQRPPAYLQNGSGIDIVGRSRTLDRVLRQVETVAPTDSTLLILGGTGTGKEFLARTTHYLSSLPNPHLV